MFSKRILLMSLILLLSCCKLSSTNFLYTSLYYRIGIVLLCNSINIFRLLFLIYSLNTGVIMLCFSKIRWILTTSSELIILAWFNFILPKMKRSFSNLEVGNSYLFWFGSYLGEQSLEEYPNLLHIVYSIDCTEKPLL